MRFPLRRVVLGFAAGAALGWVASLLRSPSDPPEGSGAESAERMPQEEFGEPVNDPEQAAEIAQEPTAPPRKATAPAVKPIPGSDREPEGAGESEPATAPEVGAEQVDEAVAGGPAGDEPGEPAKAAKPRRRRTPTTDPALGATEALREGHAAATERLTGADKPAPRRRRPPAEG